MNQYDAGRVKRNDIGVRFEDTLRAAELDFEGADVLFLLRSAEEDDTLLVSEPAVVDDTDTVGRASVHYDTATGDLSTSGRYRQEWEVSVDGMVLTFPSSGYNYVEILDDLGPDGP